MFIPGKQDAWLVWALTLEAAAQLWHQLLLEALPMLFWVHCAQAPGEAHASGLLALKVHPSTPHRPAGQTTQPSAVVLRQLIQMAPCWPLWPARVPSGGLLPCGLCPSELHLSVVLVCLYIGFHWLWVRVPCVYGCVTHLACSALCIRPPRGLELSTGFLHPSHFI